MNSLVGETEKSITEIFEAIKGKASQNTPVVVFMDEIDSLLSKRKATSGQFETRLVNTFLPLLEDLILIRILLL